MQQWCVEKDSLPWGSSVIDISSCLRAICTSLDAEDTVPKGVMPSLVDSGLHSIEDRHISVSYSLFDRSTPTGT